MAGNDNSSLVSDIKIVIEKLVFHKKLTQDQANEIIEELNELILF